MTELLEYQHFIDINEELYKMSCEDKEIEYSGKEDYPIIKRKIQALVHNVPEGTFLEIATYYLGNLILLQPFADGNHRTALHAVKLFAFKNGRKFTYNDQDAHDFQVFLFKVRDTYEAQDTEVLEKPNPDVMAVCRKFIEEHLT
jgi:prophage maintenance system killer protein